MPNDNDNDSKTVQLIALPNLMRGNYSWAKAESGTNIDELLPEAHSLVEVHLNGELLERDDWKEIVTRPGDHILVRAIPGDSNVLRAVAMLALVVADIFTVGALTPEIGAFAATLVGVGISMTGMLLINAVIPPQAPVDLSIPAGEQQAGLTGVSNQLIPYGIIPRIYGKRKVFPIIVGKPYTEVVGNDQYLRVMFCVGIGDYNISQLQIGDTSLNKFTDVQIYTKAGVVGAYTGLQIVDPTLLYGRDVSELSLSIVLTQPSGAVPMLRTTAANTQEIGLDFVMPQGLLREDNHGERFFLGVPLLIEYAVSGSGTWVNVANESTLTLSSSIFIKRSDGTLMLTAKTLDTQRAGLTWQVEIGRATCRERV